jgi:hypothetical protein
VKWFLYVLLAVAITAHADAQGLARDPYLGPTKKLHGFIISSAPDGILAVSVPLRDVVRFLAIAEKLSPHMEVLEVLEHLDRKARRIPVARRQDEVGFGVVFLDTREMIPRRHALLDRFVRKEGSYSYFNRRGVLLTVPALVRSTSDAVAP